MSEHELELRESLERLADHEGGRRLLQLALRSILRLHAKRHRRCNKKSCQNTRSHLHH